MLKRKLKKSLAQIMFSSWPLTRGEKFLFTLYGLITVIGIFFFLTSQTGEQKIVLIIVDAMCTQMGLVLFAYKHLRNLRAYLFWVGIGILHFIFFILLKETHYLEAQGDISPIFIDTLVVLMVYQVMRLLSLKIQGVDYITPGRSSSDRVDGRYPTFTDYMINIISLAIAAGLACINIANSVKH